MKPGQVRLGHFAADRWQHDSKALPELFVSGEGLKCSPAEVLGTLLHEATHGVAHVREIKDTSRQGRYHNRKFKALGEELGLVLTEDPRIGWSVTQVPPSTASTYTTELEVLTAALVAYRHAEPTIIAGGTTKTTNLAAAACLCPRRIRIASCVLTQGPITCGLCGQGFTLA